MTTILITGLGRSGSTIVQKVLNSHPDIFISDESWHFFIAAQNFANRNPRALMGMHETEYAGCIMKHLKQLYTSAANGATIFGDKCPPAFSKMNEINALLKTEHQSLTTIWTVRHPFDQAISWLERFQCDSLTELSVYGQAIPQQQQYTAEHVVEAIFNVWISQQEVMKAGPGYVIVYESMTKNPKTEFTKLHDWMQLDFQDSQLIEAFDSGVVGGDPKFNSTKSIHTASRFRYANATIEQQNLLQRVAERTNIKTYFEQYGYR